jgi:predicted phosphodiesterase
VHGSPLDEDEYIIVMRDAYMPLMTTDAAVTFFGHTHIQGGFCVHGEEWDTLRPMYRSKSELEQVSLDLRRDGKYLLNPGSVGQPRDGDWRAGCALFDSESYKVTFYRVPYNLEKAQKTILDAKLPDRLALRLADGR